MGTHPLNLALRFVLELVAWGAVGLWGWKAADGGLRYVLAIGLPLLAMGAWVIFAVPDDPSRSGHAPIATPGAIRLALELTIFAVGTWALIKAGYPRFGILLAAVAALHYALSYDRIRWLLQQ